MEQCRLLRRRGERQQEDVGGGCARRSRGQSGPWTLGLAGFEVHPELIEVHTADGGLPRYERCDDETSWITDGALPVQRERRLSLQAWRRAPGAKSPAGASTARSVTDGRDLQPKREWRVEGALFERTQRGILGEVARDLRSSSENLPRPRFSLLRMWGL